MTNDSIESITRSKSMPNKQLEYTIEGRSFHDQIFAFSNTHFDQEINSDNLSLNLRHFTAAVIPLISNQCFRTAYGMHYSLKLWFCVQTSALGEKFRCTFSLQLDMCFKTI